MIGSLNAIPRVAGTREPKPECAVLIVLMDSWDLRILTGLRANFCCYNKSGGAERSEAQTLPGGRSIGPCQVPAVRQDRSAGYNISESAHSSASASPRPGALRMTSHGVPSFPTESIEFGGSHTYSVYHCHGGGPYLVIETDPDGIWSRRRPTSSRPYCYACAFCAGLSTIMSSGRWPTHE